MTTLTETQVPAEAAAGSRAGLGLVAATGAAFAVLVVVGNGIYSEGGSETLGYSLELLGYVAFAVFVAWIIATFGAVDRVAVSLAAIGGAAMLGVKLAGWAAAMASKQDGLGTDVAAGLTGVDEQAFVIAWLPYGLFVIGLSLAALRAGRLARPVAWIGVAIGVGCVLAVPVSSTEPFVLPWLISLLWLVVASTLLARGHRRIAAGHGRGDQTWSVEV